jgi:hypothetical protein
MKLKFLVPAIIIVLVTISIFLYKRTADEDSKSYANVSSAIDNYGKCLSGKEKELADLINSYRQKNGLPALSVTKNFAKTAQLHTFDLAANKPVTSNCNMHSWSSKFEPQVTRVCYTDDHKNAELMWNKPAQISGGTYLGNGYEISASGSGGITPDKALQLWKSSPGHNSIILEKDTWGKYDWSSMGVGINGDYATVWFADNVDSTGSIELCKFTAVYRFFNLKTGAHLYTASEEEKNTLLTNAQWLFEGVKFQVQDTQITGVVPVYRLYNKNTGTHLYTISTEEKDSIIKNLNYYLFEGIKFYVYNSQSAGTIPVHRFFNTKTGAHLYTTSEEEKNGIMTNNKEFSYEGVKYYVLP